MTMVLFTVETYAGAKQEATALHLLDEHEAELNGMPEKRRMRLDDETYLAAERAGMLHLIVARDEHGAMVGYFCSFIGREKHYADVVGAFEDGYFLSKPYRRGLTGYRLIAEWKRLMVARGDVQELHGMTKVAPEHDASPLFERLGFHKTDYLMRCWIGA